jgi:hypothetical protein
MTPRQALLIPSISVSPADDSFSDLDALYDDTFSDDTIRFRPSQVFFSVEDTFCEYGVDCRDSC